MTTDGLGGLFRDQAGLGKDLDPARVKELVVHEADTGGATGEVELHLWLSSEGVKARGHYDNAHNVFIQLDGKKRITLVDPRESPALHLFPAGHPNERQSQVIPNPNPNPNPTRGSPR